jgi:hypothetical protein
MNKKKVNYQRSLSNASVGDTRQTIGIRAMEKYQ